MPTTKQEECFNVPKYSQDLEHGGERNNSSHVHDENKNKVSTNTKITKVDNTGYDDVFLDEYDGNEEDQQLVLNEKCMVPGIPQAASVTTILAKKAALKQDVLDAGGVNNNNGSSELSKEARTKLAAENDKEPLLRCTSIPEYALNTYSDDLEYDDDDDLRLFQEKHEAFGRAQHQPNNKNNDDDEASSLCASAEFNDGYKIGENNKRQSAANRTIIPTEEHRRAGVRTSGPQYAIDIEAMDDDDDDLLNAKYQQFERPASSGNRMTNMEEDTPPLAADSKSNNVSTLPGAVSVGSSRSEVRYSSKLEAWRKVHCNDHKDDCYNTPLPTDVDDRSIKISSKKLIYEQYNPESIKAMQRNMTRERTKVAILVNEQIESDALNRRVEEVIRTSTIVTAEEIDVNDGRKRRPLCIASIIVGFVVAIVVLVAILTRKSTNSNIEAFQPQPTPSPTSTLKPTLETVKERGVLRCGVPRYRLGFNVLNEITGEYEGFEIDSCRAIAAAVMGANYRIETMKLSVGERFVALANKSVDLLTEGTTHTMERDVYQADAQTGFSFTTPYLYDGLGFGGKPSFVECAKNIQAFGNCSELKICVLEATTHYKVLEDLFPARSLITSPGDMDMVEKLIINDCNVIAGEKTFISKKSIRWLGYEGDYSVDRSVISKEPLAIATRDDDYEWSQIVNWVLQAQFLAEAMNITQDNAIDFPNISPFGEKYNNMFINAISAVGNYGERYERHFGKLLPREGLNMLFVDEETTDDPRQELNTLYLGDTGLIYSNPLGPIDNDGPEPNVGSRLGKIFERGVLRCGITDARDGFAEYDSERQKWEGLDIDYCNSVAAAIFGATINSAIEYVILTTINPFDALIEYTVDVICGVDIDLEVNIEQGISFSQPYFYEGKFGLRSLATYGKEDSQFSDFVYWVVSSTFYAEEKAIKRFTSNDMPEVRIFGSHFYRMFRDAILISGNYGEMYKRNLQPIIPRSGRNNLNNLLLGPQINPYVGL